ncbi:MAG: FIST signal transduction protein [Egibacteraceae bacterium]
MTVAAATGSGTGPDPVDAARSAVARVAEGLGGRSPDLAVVFVGAAYARNLDTLDALIGERLAPRHRIGTTTGGVIAEASELERLDCISVWAACLSGAHIAPLRYEPPGGGDGPPPQGDEAPASWPEPPPDAHGVVAFADPGTFPPDAWLAWLEQARPGLPVSGGLASAGRGNRLLLDGRTYDGGAVAVAIGGDVRMRTLVSQGCRPVGNSYTVTRADRNLLQELGGAQPVRRIRETFIQADPTDQALMRDGLHIGTVIDEYKEAFHRGDFLVRGVLGAESGTGAIAVGDIMQVGQTVQFHVRDARSADEDLRELLGRFAEGEPPPCAALLFTCNGRGRRLFGMPDHDASVVQEILGDIPLAGFFCAGEFGPVGSRSFLHGFTASLLVFDRPPSPGDPAG